MNMTSLIIAAIWTFEYFLSTLLFPQRFSSFQFEEILFEFWCRVCLVFCLIKRYEPKFDESELESVVTSLT